MSTLPLFRTLSAGLVLATSTAISILPASAADAPAPAAATAAPAGKAPAAREVVDKYIAAIGGKEAVLKHGTSAVKGRWEVPVMSQGGEFELLRSKPGLQVMRIKMGDQGTILNGCDGKIAWTVNPFVGAMLLEGKMLEQAIEEADYFSILREPNTYKVLETVGLKKFNGKDAIQLKVVSKAGRETAEFYDPANGLLIGQRTSQETPQGTVEATLTFSDYKKFTDILQPTKILISAGGFEQVLTLTAVEYDKVPETAFAPPDEIKALLKK